MNVKETLPKKSTVLRGLKDFQRTTVDYVFRRLYKKQGSVKRFLIADEVGLGKTLVARGIVAKAVDLLKDKKRRIDVVYICSNWSIARQNVNRLNIAENNENVIPTRITLLPLFLKDLNQNRLNFVSFTPGTSFDLRSSGGIGKERVLIYHMLRKGWRLGNRAGPKNVFQCTMEDTNWDHLVKNFEIKKIDRNITKEFIKKLAAKGVHRRFNRLVKKFARRRKYANIPREVQKERYALIGELRAALAETCISLLEPDIVILDEFQRFRHLLDEQNELGQLARAVFNYPKVKVILLSATPYKMYTMYHEKEHEDHYADFMLTVEFLLRSKRKIKAFKEDLDQYRNAILMPAANESKDLMRIKRRIETQLRKVMVRTERLSTTADRSGMVADAPVKTAALQPLDLKSFAVLDKVAQILGVADTVEYWKSAPYLLNVMDQDGYKLKKELVAHKRSPVLKDALKNKGYAQLDWRQIQDFEPVNPANARLRTLLENKVLPGAWKLLWVPALTPYYRVRRNPHADPQLQHFTKALVFSSWLVAPKAIAMLTSYEAERQAVTAFDKKAIYSKEHKRPRLLQFTLSQGRLTGMSVFQIIYPSLTLAMKIDPLAMAVNLATNSRPPGVRQMMRSVQKAVKELLHPLIKPYQSKGGPPDESWYWAALAMLDWKYYRLPASEWLNSKHAKFAWPSMVKYRDKSANRFTDHVEKFKDQFGAPGELGRPPDDLVEVLTKVALASPAVVALRALLRHCRLYELLKSGEWLMSSAAKVALGFRTLFNLPETMALVRSLRPARDTRYWKSVLDYCVDGNLQAVMDEYVHVLKEALGVAEIAPEKAIPQIAQEILKAVSIRTVNLDFDEILPDSAHGGLKLDRHSMRCRFALRFGDGKSEEERTEIRKDQVRIAFNSPFRPFVLATTSIGQEGLDFHQYCHEIYHWNLPSNPVDLEQREGRIHRYKGHVIRRNIAKAFPISSLKSYDIGMKDPWQIWFEMACEGREPHQNDIVPFWIFELENGHKIWRFIPSLPLSRELEQLEDLKNSLVAYRMVLGQPRQEDLVTFLQQRFNEELDADEFLKYRIDLTPK